MQGAIFMPKIKKEKENKKMGKEKYDAIRIAKQLGYDTIVIERIKEATSEIEITRIMKTTRETLR